MRHLCVMINTVLTLADKLRYDEWSSDRGVVSEAWRVYDRLNFHVYVCMFSIYKKGLIDITFVCVCVVCVCVLQSVGSVSVPPDTGLRPTCFWGKEDKREINCSTSSPASALLLREQFVGCHKREGMKGGGRATIWRSWEILWSSSDFLLWIWADAPVSRSSNTVSISQEAECNISQSAIASDTPAFSFFLFSAHPDRHS